MFNNQTNNLENNRLNNLLYSENAECKTYSVKETAAILGIAQSMVYKMVSNQDIPYLKFGARVVIPREAFNNWFDANIKGGAVTCVAQ